jgi:hypothetical protein
MISRCEQYIYCVFQQWGFSGGFKFHKSGSEISEYDRDVVATSACDRGWLGGCEEGQVRALMCWCVWAHPCLLFKKIASLLSSQQ